MKLANENPDQVVVLFQDECSFYRQPSTGWLWSWMGRTQPKMRYAHKNNTCMRVVGYLNATTGVLHSDDMEAVTAQNLARNVSKVSSWYPHAKKIFLAWDNWPNHYSAPVRKAIKQQKRVEVLHLPTYSPWLNPIEKVWRRARQNVSHAHPWCDRFDEFRRQVHAELGSMAEGSSDLLRYVGLLV